MNLFTPASLSRGFPAQSLVSSHRHGGQERQDTLIKRNEALDRHRAVGSGCAGPGLKNSGP
jgi:hypothetical protein